MRTEQEKQKGREDLRLYREDRERVEAIQESREKLSRAEFPLTGHQVIMEALDPTQSRRVYRVIIDLENDALQDDDGNVDRFELADILQSLSNAVEAGDLDHDAIQDTNGNTVGHAEVIEASS